MYELIPTDGTTPVSDEKDERETALTAGEMPGINEMGAALEANSIGQVNARRRQGFAKLLTMLRQETTSILPAQKEMSCRN